MNRAFGLLVVVALPACRGETSHATTDAARAIDVAKALTDAHALADAALPPRCTLVPGAEGPAFGDGDELGEAVPFRDGFAVGLLGKRDGGRGASVVLLGHDAPVTTALGPVTREAPAPQPFVSGGEPYAVAYVDLRANQPHAPSMHTAPRALSVFHVGASAERLLALPSETDPSVAYDVLAPTVAGAPLGALIAWDEDTGSPPHSLVRVAALTHDLRALQHDATIRVAQAAGEPAADAGDPRLALRDGGYWLTYVARRPERAPSTLPLPAGEIETPSEESTYGWVEALMLDADGAPKGSAKRLTPEAGHVASYAVWSHGAVLEVVAKDEGATGSGGRLVRVAWNGGEGDPDVHTLVQAGVEEEVPPVVTPDGPDGAWLTFLDVAGNAELLPLGPKVAATATPTHEPLLAGGRLLGTAGANVALIVLRGAAWSRADAICAR